MRSRRTNVVAGIREAVSPLVRRHRPDYRLVVLMGILVLIGLVVLFAISPYRVESINLEGGTLDQAHFMQRQVLYLAAGVAAFAFAAIAPLTLWKKFTNKILLLGLAACLLLAFLGLFLDGGPVIEAGGATRWFNLGFSSFQPAELLKFGMLLYIASFLGRRIQQGKINSLNETLWPLALLVGVASLFIIVLQKDMGTGITMLGMVASMLFVSGLNARLILTAGAAAVGVGILLVVTSPHRIERVATFFSDNPADASGYHINQAAIALGSGGLTGRGLGHSVQAFGYLPEALNDSIFAVLGETFGFVGLVVILAIFVALLMRLLKIQERLVDPTWRLIVAGTFGLIATHVVVNVGAMTGVFPLTGVTLPFLSFGGTSLLFMMLSLGLVLQLSRYTTHMDVTKETGDENSQRRRGFGRSRHAGPGRFERA
jgi:cell division protein FtsW